MYLKIEIDVVAERQKEYNRRYYARQKEKNKMRKIALGEGSSQSLTHLTNISPIELTQGNINGTSPGSSALNFAQRRKIVNRKYYQRSKENINAVNGKNHAIVIILNLILFFFIIIIIFIFKCLVYRRLY